MNRNHNILFSALLLMSGCCLQSCQDDDLGGTSPSREELIERGMYLSARSEDNDLLLSDTEEPRLFKENTPYRLIAFSKPYNATDAQSIARFNKVAWEGTTSSGMHYINIDSDPDKWFGFKALPGETGDPVDGLVSLDFYGFTYGAPVSSEADRSGYIPVVGWDDKLLPTTISESGWSGNTAPSIDNITRTETVDESGKLNDLMRGELLDQNIATAGVESTDPDGNQNPTYHAQSVMPFKHCFSKLHFQISQQGNDDVLDKDGNPTKSFDNLYVDDITITGTYRTGTVALKDGKVKIGGDKIDRPLNFKSGYTGEVTLNNTDAGDMIIFPSDGACLQNTELSGGYIVGLNITVRSTVKDDIKNMLINTGTVTDDKEADNVITTTTTDGGTTWYSGTIKKDKIIDYYDTSVNNAPLYFRQNSAYMFIIVFQDDAVRILTVIPQVEEWLPGEGTADDPWQNKEIGQPQMFDNIVWSDRNLGSNYFDPTDDDYEWTVGYFFQPGRNIPYLPFKYKNYQNKDANGNRIDPVVADIYTQDLANGNSEYNNTEYRFFPIVDRRIRKMSGSEDWTIHNSQTPQMYVPQSKPTDDTFFDFLAGTSADSKSGLTDVQNLHWDSKQGNQPVHGAWRVPSSKDFLTIFPSTPYAGNITFRKGSTLRDPMSWRPDAMDNRVKVLRVTVPYYDTFECKNPWKKNPSAKYTEAWNTLRDHNDPGCTIFIPGTNICAYNLRPGYDGNPNHEPDGDPADGFASAYIISREGDDLYAPDILQHANKYNPNGWGVKSWGTIYAIKRIYTPGAYRMRWRVLSSSKSAINPCFYVEICRYRCQANNELTIDNYKDYDWDHPAAKLYLPICGLGDWTGKYINFGTECQYATSDPIKDGKTSSVQIKVTGHDAYNAYLAVVTGVINRNFGVQIRPVLAGTGGGIN